MSLTSFLDTPEVKARFKQDWPLPFPRPSTKDWSMTAPPVSPRPAIIGTAFDYIFRFHLRRLHPTSDPHEGWIAENALGRMKGSMRKVGDGICRTARVRYEEFINGKNLDDDLLSSSVLLAQLDGVFRSGGMLPASGEFTIEPTDLADLKQLVESCDWMQWKAEQVCSLNPGFGLASALVGGADADFQLDEVLYELKTVRQVTSLAAHYHQLVGYSALNFLSDGPPISRVAIYFSRFARTMTWSAPNWNDAQHEPFLLWFCRAAEANFGSSGLIVNCLAEEMPVTSTLRLQLEALATKLHKGNR